MGATHKKAAALAVRRGSGGRRHPRGAGRRRETLRVSDLAEVSRRFGAVPVVTGAAPARPPRLVAVPAGAKSRSMIGASPPATARDEVGRADPPAASRPGRFDGSPEKAWPDQRREPRGVRGDP
jgi:hypothetical protein